MKMPTSPCPVTLTTCVMGGKWKARIVWALIREAPLRYSAIRASCPPISDRILSKELKELEQLGLIARKDHAVMPPRTDYRLTALGWTLEPVMAAMADWGMNHRAKVMQATNAMPPASG